jgi:hypothetical protein
MAVIHDDDAINVNRKTKQKSREVPLSPVASLFVDYY